MQLKLNVPEVVELFNAIQVAPSSIFELIRMNVQEEVGNYLSNLMGAELSHFLGRERYEHGSRDGNYRNGNYERKFCLKGIGEVTVSVPRDRHGEFKTEVLPKSQRYETAIAEDFALMYLTGISTRTLALLSKRLIGRKISPEEVSKANRELTAAVEQWRMRDLSREPVKYLYIDGVNFAMRSGRKIERIPVLVAIGVREDGTRLVLGLQSGDKESATSWREFFKDLKRRGLDGSKVTLGIMDGLPALEKVFQEEFSNAKTQRCQVHVARNVLAKVPRSQKQAVADDLRSIFYATSKKKALEFYESFQERWAKEVPSAVKCLEQSLESCLTFFSFPEEEWLSLRTTNIIERLNKEFRRRTKTMEIVAGENACYRLLAFISLKMELSWRANRVGKLKPGLPSLKKITQNN
jgi:putative transposase